MLELIKYAFGLFMIVSIMFGSIIIFFTLIRYITSDLNFIQSFKKTWNELMK